jgi:hypothetical protein
MTKAKGESFGCNRRGTREKTQTSKKTAAQEDLQEERSIVMRIGWHRNKNPKVKKSQIVIQVLSKMRLN